MRAREFIYEHRLDEDVEDFPIANVRKANGAIGNQGVNTEQAADVLTHAAGMQVSPDMSMRQLVDALQADPAAQQRLRQFVQKNPVTVYALPDGSYHLQDGHHRTFLLNLLGDETVPAVVKEDVTEAKTVEFEGLTLKVIKQGHELTVDALDDWGNKVLGHVKFNIGDGKELDPQDLHVDDKYQGQGIARVMYDYVKSLGYTIVRSWDQTDAGAGFWNKHRGEDVRVWEATDSKQLDPDIFEDLDSRIIAREAKKIVPSIRAKQTPEGYVYLKTADGLSLVIGCNIADGGIDINIGSQPMEATSSGPHKGAITEIIQAVYAAAVKQYGTPSQPGYLSVDHDAGHGVWQHIAQKLGLQYDAHMVKENFADGKGPGRPGDSQRHGIPKHATMAELEKASHADGRKGQLARWQLNMRRGHKK